MVVALAAMVGSAPNEPYLLGVGQGGRYVLPATGPRGRGLIAGTLRSLPGMNSIGWISSVGALGAFG